MRPTIFLMRSRRPQNPDKVPFKMQMPFVLKNSVAGKGSQVSEKGCLFEISLVLSCLQENNFENKFCTKEVSAFHRCYETFLTDKNTAKEQARKGILTPNTKKLRYNQINIMLKRYPQV